MNLHNKKHGTYVDSAYTFFQFCPYPEDGLPIHCCSVSYSCDVSLRKLKLENCLCTGYFGSPFLPEREKEKALKSLNFRALLSFAICFRGAYGTTPLFLYINSKSVTYIQKNTVRISKSNDLETIFKISILSFVTPLCLFSFSGSKLYTFSETTKCLIINFIYFFIQCKVRAYI